MQIIQGTPDVERSDRNGPTYVKISEKSFTLPRNVEPQDLTVDLEATFRQRMCNCRCSIYRTEYMPLVFDKH